MVTNPESVPNKPIGEPVSPAQAERAPVQAERKANRKVKQTRVGYTWSGLVIGTFVLVILLIFILQNLDSVKVDLLFWSFSLPIGVGALLAAIAGALIMALVGGVRIIQIRRAAKKM